VLATFAGLTFTGCNGAQAPTTVGTTAGSTVGVTSGPARLRSALTLALRHLDLLPRAASQPFHLVAFRGRGLDENGGTIAANGSDWEFVFSRYAESGPSQRYEVVSVLVPGAGQTRVTSLESTDPAMSPIENWDQAAEGSSPDSADLLAYLKGKGVATAGATITFAQGVVRIEAGGKAYAYSPTEGDYTQL
jgi:hypothetical protein